MRLSILQLLMNFDYKSILFFIVLTNISIIVIFSYVMVIKNLQRWFLVVFLISKVLHTLGLVGVAMRGIIPDLLSIHFSNFFLLISSAAIAISIISYDGEFSPKLSYSLIFTSILFFIGRTILKDNLAYRSVAQTLGEVIIYGISGIALFYRKEKLYLKSFIAVTFLFYSLFQLFRSYVIFNIREEYSFFNGSSIDSVYLIISVFIVNINNIGFILMLLEINEIELSKKNILIAADREELKVLNQTKDKFFSIIAHDLRSPIGTMSEMLTIINTSFKDELSDSMLKIFKVLNDSAKNTFSLIENLLTWSRSQSGAIRFSPQKINLFEIIKNNINLNLYSAQDKNITIENRIDREIFVYVDFSMIDAVVRNLLNNAVKYTFDNGVIVISHSFLENKVKVSISDSGIGMSNETVGNLFKPNSSRIVKIGTKGEKGTGLGLVLCKEFIEKNEGEIWVESSEGNGSTFYFTLPFATID